MINYQIIHQTYTKGKVGEEQTPYIIIVQAKRFIIFSVRYFTNSSNSSSFIGKYIPLKSNVN